jgi:MFS family permease
MMKNKNLVASLLMAFLSLGIMQWFARGHFGDPDGYYHASMSKLLWQGSLGDVFPWMTQTSWSEYFANQHFLYHVLLRPFADLSLLPVSIVLFGSLFVATFLFLLKSWKIAWLPFWAVLLLFGSTDFLFRINLAKAIGLSLVLLCLALWAITTKKPWLLFPISAVFVWVYGGFVFLPVIVFVYVAVEFIYYRSFNWRLCVALFLGIGLGLVLHPQFPNILRHLYDQIFQAGLGSGGSVKVGNEWYPYRLDNFLNTNGLLLLVWLVSVGVGLRQLFSRSLDRGYRSNLTSLLILSLFFLILTFRSRRFVEYWVPIAVIQSAWTLSPYLIQIKLDVVRSHLRKFWVFGLGVAIVTSLFIIACVNNARLVTDQLQNTPVSVKYKPAAEWLLANSNERDIIFNTVWDQFPQLFYWNNKNYYIVGMDPTFMYLHDKDKYWLWRQVSDDEVIKFDHEHKLRDIVKDQFNAKFLFVENDRNPKLKLLLETDQIVKQDFPIVYSDSDVSLYQVR